MTYHFLNPNGWNVEVWEWTSNFIPNIIVDVVTIHYGIEIDRA